MKRQLILIFALTAASQLAAFFKLWFTARIFGVSVELDGYNLALILPTLVSGVASGFLQTGLFPIRARLNAEGSALEVAALERTVLWGVGFLGLGIGFMLLLAAPMLVPALGHTVPAPTLSALRYAFPWLALLVALNMISDCAGYLLAMRGWFTVAAGAPIISGLIGGCLLAAWPQGGLVNLVGGTLFALLVQVCICLAGLRRSGLSLTGYLMGRRLMSSFVKQMFQLGMWILPGLVFSNLIASLATLWMSNFGAGAVSAFGYAQRLHSSAVQLLIMASSPVVLAHLSELVVRNDMPAIGRVLRHAAALSAIVGLTAVAGVYFLGAPVLSWTFGGRFDADAARRVAEHWWWLSLGLGFSILGNVFAKLWQSQRRPALISVMAGGNLIVFGLTYVLFSRAIGEYSVSAALATSAASVVFFGLPFLGLRAPHKHTGI